MTRTAFLLTLNMEIEEKILSIVGREYEIRSVNKGNIMMEMIKTPPFLIIADVKSYGEQIMDYIRTMLNIEYIPVIYLSDHEGNLSEQDNEMILPFESIQEHIGLLMKQAMIFKRRYEGLSESYYAIDIINRAANDLLKHTDSRNSGDFNKIILSMIDKTYGANIFIENKPDQIWWFSGDETDYKAVRFILKGKKYSEDLRYCFNRADNFKFDINGENGFSKNYNANEFSDIGYKDGIFPSAISEHTRKLKNFAGYSIGGMTIIGMNFINNVANQEVDILKMLVTNLDMVATIEKQVNELEESFNYTMDALARAAEANDDVTGHHIKRVNIFSRMLSEEMGLDEAFIYKIENAAQMHDVGKIYVDRNILTKPGKLTTEEFEEIKMHTVYGEKIIGDSVNLKLAAEVARNHHERYDGSGYPDQKAGEQIPISARIVCLADIYDALRSERPYKKGFSHDEAYQIITKGDGRVEPSHFDPMVLNAFKNIQEAFEREYELLKD